MKRLILNPAVVTAFALLALLSAYLAVDAAQDSFVTEASACDAKLHVDVASNPLNQIPVGTIVTHKVRVRSAACGTYSDVVLTLRPPSGQTLVSTGNTGPWNCTAGADNVLTCTRDSFPSGKASTLSLTYEQGQYFDSQGKARACVDSSETTENCQSAYSTHLP